MEFVSGSAYRMSTDTGRSAPATAGSIRFLSRPRRHRIMEWNIQSRAHACQECGRGFKHREAFHTLLFDQRGEYHRLDVCAGCWDGQFSLAANNRKGFVSHWQGVFEVPPPGAPDPIQKDTAETLLRKLVTLNDPRHAGAVFILAVMLERKRLLRVRDQQVTDGQRVIVYEHPKSGDVFTIPDPALQLNQLEAVQRDVAQLLEHGLNPPPADAAASDPVKAAAVTAVTPADATAEQTSETVATPIEPASAAAATNPAT
jgi:hypothetical protein